MSYPRELRLDGVLRTSGVGGTRKCAPGLRPVSAGTIPDRLLPFGRYDQEAARARFRRSVARLHQLGGQPLAQRPVLGIPLWVQPALWATSETIACFPPAPVPLLVSSLSARRKLSRSSSSLWGDSLAKTLTSSCRLPPDRLRANSPPCSPPVRRTSPKRRSPKLSMLFPLKR